LLRGRESRRFSWRVSNRQPISDHRHKEGYSRHSTCFKARLLFFCYKPVRSQTIPQDPPRIFWRPQPLPSPTLLLIAIRAGLGRLLRRDDGPSPNFARLFSNLFSIWILTAHKLRLFLRRRNKVHHLVQVPPPTNFFGKRLPMTNPPCDMALWLNFSWSQVAPPVSSSNG